MPFHCPQTSAHMELASLSPASLVPASVTSASLAPSPGPAGEPRRAGWRRGLGGGVGGVGGVGGGAGGGVGGLAALGQEDAARPR